jgi:hypothetical protein
MTTRNYTVALGKPFVRVSQLIIDYPAPSTAHVRMSEELAILTDTGTIEKIRDLGDTRFVIGPGDMATSLTLVHPATAQPLGPTMTYEQLMLGLLAAVRKNQLERDNPPAPPPQPE